MTKKNIHTYKYLLYILFHPRSIYLIREDVNQYKSNIATCCNLQGVNIYIEHIKYKDLYDEQIISFLKYQHFVPFEKQRQTNYFVTHAPTVFSQCQIMVYYLTCYLFFCATFPFFSNF
jgi:hypothetical protein